MVRAMMKFVASLPEPDNKLWKINHDNNLLYIYEIKPKLFHVKLKYRQKNPNSNPEIYFETNKAKIVLSFEDNEIVYSYQKYDTNKRLSTNEKVTNLIKTYKNGELTRLNMQTESLMMNENNVLDVAIHNYILTKINKVSIFVRSHGIHFKNNPILTSQLYRGPLDKKLLSLSLLKKYDSYKTREFDNTTNFNELVIKEEIK